MNTKSFQTSTRKNYRPSLVRINGVAATLASVLSLIAVLGAAWLDSTNVSAGWIIAWIIAFSLVSLYVLIGLKIAQQWEKAIVLRLGKFSKLAGPGLFWIIPIVDELANWIDHRVMVTPFSAERTLTRENMAFGYDFVKSAKLLLLCLYSRSIVNLYVYISH